MKKQILLLMLLFIITTGCNKKEDDLALLGLAAAGSTPTAPADTTPKVYNAEVSNISIGTSKVGTWDTLSWTNPADPDLAGFEIIFTCKGTTITSTLEGLTSNIDVSIASFYFDLGSTVTIKAVNKSGVRSKGVSATVSAKTPG